MKNVILSSTRECARATRVAVRGASRTTYRGTVRYIGPISGSKAGGDFVGIELRAPHGKNDGRGYFKCRPNHGLFVRPKSIIEILGPAGGSTDIQRVNGYGGGGGSLYGGPCLPLDRTTERGLYGHDDWLLWPPVRSEIAHIAVEVGRGMPSQSSLGPRRQRWGSRGPQIQQADL